MKEEEVSKLKVAELKEELRSRDLSISGLKADLAKRLLEAVQHEAKGEKAEDNPAEREEAIAAPEASAGDAEEDIEAPESESKGATSSKASDAAQQEPKEDASAKQDSKDDAAAIDAKAEEKAGVPALAVASKKAEAPAAAAISDKKQQDEATVEKICDSLSETVKASKSSTENGPAAIVSKKSAADAPVVGTSTDSAKEPVADLQAVKSLAGDSISAASKAEKDKPEEKPAASEALDAAAPQAAANVSAAPQVDVLGSVEVAAPLQETAEEELDYDADEVMEQAPVPVTTQTDAKQEETSRKRRPADSEGVRSSKAQKTEESERRKREPIAFKPRDKSASGSGQLAEDGQREGSADLRRTGSQTEKRSVFERLHSGAGKEASMPRRAPPSREAASRALFITGFVRPFTENQAKAMLSETGDIQGFWMPKIKDRAYIVYASEEEAEATRNAVSGIEWPVGNGNSLRPKFAPLEDAERTIKTGQPPEMRMEVSATATAPQPVRAAAAAAAEPARAAPARPAAPVQNGPAAQQAKPKDMREILEERRRARDGKRGTAPAAAPTQARPTPAAPQPEAVPEPEPIEEEEEPKALEDLFRKTETKPWLYWLPLTEERIAEKAAGDVSQLPGPPAKPVQQ